jgi:hypothetical protein
VIDNLNGVGYKEADFEEKRNLLLCFLFILKNLNQALLSWWWKNETQLRIVALFDALLQCTEIFEATPALHLLC